MTMHEGENTEGRVCSRRDFLGKLSVTAFGAAAGAGLIGSLAGLKPSLVPGPSKAQLATSPSREEPSSGGPQGSTVLYGLGKTLARMLK